MNDEYLEENIELYEYLNYDELESRDFMTYDILEDENGDPRELYFE